MEVHMSRLVMIKSLHTLVFVFMSVCILYILYCGLTRTYDWKLAIALVAVALESIVFLVNGRRCPLTAVARHYGAAVGDNWTADIFLPGWCIPLVTPVCSVLFVAGLVALLLNILLFSL
jgi:hypothetical protein